MASQIAHVIYTDQFFKKLDMGKIANLNHPAGKIDRDEFMLGSVFPDIRRIDSSIKRRDTHLYFPKIDLDFSNLSSFEAGWKFHLWCDMKREDILNKHRFYELEHTSELYNHPAKILEDELVYDYYQNWEKVVWFFKNAPYKKTLSYISEETFKLWYAIVSKYVEKKPDSSSMHAFLIKQQRLPAKVEEIIDYVNRIRKNKKAVEIILKIKDEII